MIERVHYYGKWWLPRNPERSFLGTFTFSQFEGALLNLEGFLTNNKQDRFKNEIILGQTWDGRKITLYICLTTSASGFNSSVVKPEWVFIGMHFFVRFILIFYLAQFFFSSVDLIGLSYGLMIAMVYCVEHKRHSFLIYRLKKEYDHGFLSHLSFLPCLPVHFCYMFVHLNLSILKTL
jgi:ApeA N-terminal domain 1